MAENTSAKFEFIASFIMPNSIIEWFEFVQQNEKALSFYLNRGFVPVRRDETDPNGRPFPILHLSLPETTR